MKTETTDQPAGPKCHNFGVVAKQDKDGEFLTLILLCSFCGQVKKVDFND